MDAKASKEKEATLYDREQDFSFLKVCHFSQVSIKPPNKTETNTCDLIRAFAHVNQHVNLFTCRGQKLLEPITPSRITPLRGGSSPTTTEAVVAIEAEEMATSAGV